MEFKEILSVNDYLLYQELSVFAKQIGYKHQIAKTKDLIHLYLHPKSRERVLKFSYSEKHGFSVHLKFHKTKSYSHIFHEAIRKTIEESDLRYTGCYRGCTKCDGTEGYTYIYEDGRTYFRCYQELIELFDIKMNDLEEIKQMLVKQLNL